MNKNEDLNHIKDKIDNLIYNMKLMEGVKAKNEGRDVRQAVERISQMSRQQALDYGLKKNYITEREIKSVNQ